MEDEDWERVAENMTPKPPEHHWYDPIADLCSEYQVGAFLLMTLLLAGFLLCLRYLVS